MLVILEVAQYARLDSNVEVIGLVRSHRHETCTHDKAVHLSAYRAVHISDLVRVEVVACREVYVPILGWPNITIEAQVLRELAFIFHLLVVESSIAIVERIVHRQAPRTLPLHISIGPKSDVGPSSFGVVVSITARHIIRVPILLFLVVGILLLAPEELLEGIVVKGIGERSAGARQSAPSATMEETQLIDAHWIAIFVEAIFIHVPCGTEI